MSQPVLTLLTDYGLQDEFVGVCHGVIARICPQARIIDVTHGIAPQDVLGGALRLAAALPYLPNAVHVGVVDPGVGSERRAVAVRCASGQRFVGPDNGLLWPAAQRSGGVVEAVEISKSPFRLEPVSVTFHGRDIFAPVAAHLAAGRSLAEAGEPLDPDALLRLELPRAEIQDGQVRATVLLADRFGNLQLNCCAGELELQPGERLSIGSHRVLYGKKFSDADPGELVLYPDAAGRLALAVNQGSARSRLGVHPGDALEIRPVLARTL
ncbi:MAG TPA: SAM-dependent chlorinase/fluorinase [Solirubrobacteraceae bacterium]|nr:SAM-dependent chlorinase/fluorinase [Solirubrobacteraceae bacterium]